TYEQVHALKHQYLPFSPDTDIVPIGESVTENSESLIATIEQIVLQANYQPLAGEDLMLALSEKSIGVEVKVDLDDFEHCTVFYRGKGIVQEQQRDWKSFFVRFKTVSTNTYRRLFLVMKHKPIEQRCVELSEQGNISLQKAKKQLIASRTVLGADVDDVNIHLKLFKDIPVSDLEILFPNLQVKMRGWDKIKLGITGGGGTLGGIFVTIGKLSVATNFIGAAIAIGGFAGVLWRQVTKIFALHTHYLATLAKRLYFHNLDNNMGALMHLVEMAEAEERKEAILAYFFLMQPIDYDRALLDEHIEAFLLKLSQHKIDFDLDDALSKLTALDVLVETDAGVLDVLPIEQALKKIQSEWANL
ncbi:MAG: DUF3754 domain-containing protein, partial [Methylococcales bacterium]|nr:DUF3754 domain-containing protein [Methylococcales bacterium]